MANLRDIPDEFHDPTRITEVIIYIRMLPIDPISKRDLLFLWALEVGTGILEPNITQVMTPIKFKPDVS